MAEGLSDTKAALAAIHTLGLEHPDEALLESFVTDSVNHDQAAAYLLNTSKHTPDLKAFLTEWKSIVSMFRRDTCPGATRDRHLITSVTKRDEKCCITGMPGSFWDPLAVVPILPRLELDDLATSSCRGMLKAFLTAELTDQLLSYAAESALFDRVENHWLLRKSAAVAFAQGYFQLIFKRQNPKDYQVSTNWIGGPRFPRLFYKVDDFRPGSFVDHSASGVPTPDRFPLEILSHFATPLRWAYISEEIASRRQKRPRRASLPSPFRTGVSSFLSSTCTAIFTTAWLCVPGRMRTRVYRSLASLGVRIYGRTESFKVQQLPFGLYLKTTSIQYSGGLVNEHTALELVRRHTDIPVPRAVDLVSDEKHLYLVTTRLPGSKLGLRLNSMSDRDTAVVVRDLGRHLAALRQIPRPPGWKHAIAGTADGPCYDFRVDAALLDGDQNRGGASGPFVSEADFNEALRIGALPGLVHRAGHEIVFTHSDLNMRNVLVDEDGRVSGIVDWENAGWFPEYWEYTKALWVSKHNRRWHKMLGAMFRPFGDFRGELETERQYWNYCF